LKTIFALLIIPFLLLTPVGARSMIIPLNTWQANNITIRSIAYGGTHYQPGITYTYENYQIFAVQDCRALVTIVNLSTGKLLIIGTTQESGSCWYWYNWVGQTQPYIDPIFANSWLTINDVVVIASTYTT